MTLDEVTQLHMNGVGSSNRTPIPFVQSQVAPPANDSLAHIAQPSGNPKFNQLSINDVKFMAQFRDSDSLHLPDIVAKVQNRGKALSKYAKSVGAKEFVRSYFNKK